MNWNILYFISIKNIILEVCHLFKTKIACGTSPVIFSHIKIVYRAHTSKWSQSGMATENRGLKEKLDSIKTAQFVWMTYCLLSQAAGCLALSLDLQPQNNPKAGKHWIHAMQISSRWYFLVFRGVKTYFQKSLFFFHLTFLSSPHSITVFPVSQPVPPTIYSTPHPPPLSVPPSSLPLSLPQTWAG